MISLRNLNFLLGFFLIFSHFALASFLESSELSKLVWVSVDRLPIKKSEMEFLKLNRPGGIVIRSSAIKGSSKRSQIDLSDLLSQHKNDSIILLEFGYQENWQKLGFLSSLAPPKVAFETHDSQIIRNWEETRSLILRSRGLNAQLAPCPNEREPLLAFCENNSLKESKESWDLNELTKSNLSFAMASIQARVLPLFPVHAAEFTSGNLSKKVDGSRLNLRDQDQVKSSSQIKSESPFSSSYQMLGDLESTAILWSGPLGSWNLFKRTSGNQSLLIYDMSAISNFNSNQASNILLEQPQIDAVLIRIGSMPELIRQLRKLSSNNQVGNLSALIAGKSTKINSLRGQLDFKIKHKTDTGTSKLQAKIDETNLSILKTNFAREWHQLPKTHLNGLDRVFVVSVHANFQDQFKKHWTKSISKLSFNEFILSKSNQNARLPAQTNHQLVIVAASKPEQLQKISKLGPEQTKEILLVIVSDIPFSTSLDSKFAGVLRIKHPHAELPGLIARSLTQLK